MIKSTRDVSWEETMEKQGEIEYLPPAGARRILMGKRLSRNLAVSALLLLAIVSVRNAELPGGQTILTAAKSLTEGGWDETLGKISFVGNFLPETISVFLEGTPTASLALPCSGPMVHVYSAGEPYLGYESRDGQVYCVSDGDVMAVAHGVNEEIILRVRQDDGLEAFYYNLEKTAFSEGDRLTRGQAVGTLLAGNQAILEIRKNGRPIDPTSFFLNQAQP